MLSLLTKRSLRARRLIPLLVAAFYHLSGNSLALAQSAPGIVAAYGFSEGTGTTTADASAERDHGHAPRRHLDQSAASTATGCHLTGPRPMWIWASAGGSEIDRHMSWSAWINATANPADDGQIVAKSGGTGDSGWKLKTSPDTGPHRLVGGIVERDSGRAALQQHGPGAQHVVPRGWRLQRRGRDAGYLRQRRAGQRGAGAGRCRRRRSTRPSVCEHRPADWQ